MTASEMTEGDGFPEVWKSIPGFSAYEASDFGRIRSIDRTVNSRQLKGKVLATRVSNSGYLLVKLYDDDSGKQQTRTVHSLVLLTFAGPRPDGMETLHGEGGALDNRWPQNIRYGTREENVADWKVSNPARPKPVKHCVRCDTVMTGNGRRCHPCVVEIGEEGARLLRSGVTLGAAAEQLAYPSMDGLHTLAVKYGGYGVERPPWTQRVTTTLRRLIAGGDVR